MVPASTTSFSLLNRHLGNITHHIKESDIIWEVDRNGAHHCESIPGKVWHLAGFAIVRHFEIPEKTISAVLCFVAIVVSSPPRIRNIFCGQPRGLSFQIHFRCRIGWKVNRHCVFIQIPGCKTLESQGSNLPLADGWQSEFYFFEFAFSRMIVLIGQPITEGVCCVI